MNRNLFTDQAYSRQPSFKPQYNQRRHNDVAPRGRHGEQRPLPRRPTGPPSPTPVRQTARQTTRHTTTRLNSQRDRDFEDPTCNSTVFSEDEVPKWSWKAMVASVTSMTLFASVFGVIGVLFASLAYADHKVGDYRRSKFKTRLAWFFALFGITVTVLALVFLFIIMYALNVPKPTFKDSQYWVRPWLYDQLEDQ